MDGDEQSDEKVMTVVEHLDELRTRLIRSLLVFVVTLVVTFFFGKEIIKFLELPAGNITFQALSIEEPLMVYCKVSFYAALVVSAPYLLFEIAGFIAPGLKPAEQKIMMPIVLGGPLLFVLGALFCHQFVLPPMLTFFNSFGVGISPVQQRLDFYISLVTMMMLYMGFCFQLPLVIFAASLAGLVNSRQLLATWKYALVISSVVAAIITPDPTVISMLIVMAALMGLYLISILMLKLTGR
ncbi:MAG: twin-arginine translocase subunit TatC [Candidatus Obscuribacterales bacterium]|nr:twin-arginine translocase subunit TatC [Candidatus Obscuribacterales bacterium]